MRGIRWWVLAFAVLLPAVAFAGGPRFVTGRPFFTGQEGQPIGWRQANLRYYTDPGGLSASVDHQAADALVAAAAGVWNLPVASITVSQGGTLAEHVSGQNVFLDASGMAFPDDVMSANASAVPLAVIYDTDGSVTDLLLGSGASDPSGCRQNAVTETVDSFDPAGYILHAMIVVNGRCTGAAPEAQLELQYQLMRVFGRVLGLAWSQTNDNAYTGSPAPTHEQAMHWPIMHPLDIICGLYAYQCLPSPFQLRPDDVGSMVAVYQIKGNGTVASGKQDSLGAANEATGHLYFPTGEGMAGVNVVVKREPNGGSTFDPFWVASGVTGAGFRRGGRSPFGVADGSAEGSFGSSDPNRMGQYWIAYVPIPTEVPWQNLLVSTEAVNPLYTGTHGLGPYPPGNVAPSGSPVSQIGYGNAPYSGTNLELTAADAGPTCGNGQDGTAAAPVQAAARGWWKGLLCGYGHASYVEAAVRPSRSFTVEVTALDAQGIATLSKAMPVIGVFAETDGATDLPSLGVTNAAFNSVAVGMTTISAATGQMTHLRFGIADERGDGRPDFNYQARLFYADSILPQTIGAAGGTITIAGMGFRAGNALMINGVAAKVISWTANTIVATAPTMAAAKAVDGAAVDIVVTDRTTHATTSMTAALTYTTAAILPNVMRLVTAPAATMYVGDVTATPFAVQVLKADGVTPVVGDAVVFTLAAGSAQFATCGGAACTVTTDSQGMASTDVTPLAAGAVTMVARDSGLTQSASFTAVPKAGSLFVYSAPSGNLPVGVIAPTPIALTDMQTNNGGRYPGRDVTFTVTNGSATFSGCAGQICTLTTNWQGDVKISVTPTAIGPITIQASDGAVTTTVSFVGVSNVDVMTVASAPVASAYLGDYIGQFAVNLFGPDGMTRDQYEMVTFTAPPGVLLDPCKSNTCTSSSGWNGVAGVSIEATQVGTYTVQATYGSATQTVTFSILAHTIALTITSAPTGNVAVGAVAATPFSAQLLQDGIYPVAGYTVALGGPVGVVGLTACGNASAACRLDTDGNGMVTTGVIPLAPGSITLSAVYSPNTVTATFTAVGVGETMSILQQPPATIFVGDPVNFGVQVIAPGGLGPMSTSVLYSIVSGPFGFSDWTTAQVNRNTDGNGDSFEVGVASAAGPITVTASDGVTSQTFSFLALARPDVVRVVSVPASGGLAGTQAAVPFAVQVLMNDGVTPLAMRTVTITITNGTGSLAACGGAATCQLVTDSQGMISTPVTPLAAGTITLFATEGGVQQTVSFTAIPPIAPPALSVTALSPATYIAASATVTLTLQAAVLSNGTPAASQAVQWTLTQGFAAAATTTVTDSIGIASEFAVLGPVAAGAQATATACAWGNVCDGFHAYGVAPASEGILVVSGGQQIVHNGAALAPVVVQVVDPAGHPVAAAGVSVYQTMSAYNGVCPDRGRCPAEEVLATRATVVVSGLDGLVTVVPLAQPAVATQTAISFSVGTQGFATVVSIRVP